MISIDLLEVLIRSVPQYFLFGALALYLFAWIDKKPLLGKIAEFILVATGLLAALVLISGMIPSPDTEGLNRDHIEQVIKMLLLLCSIGLFALISLFIRFARKAAFKPLPVLIFIASFILFFQITRLSKVKFELNRPEVTLDSVQESNP